MPIPTLSPAPTVTPNVYGGDPAAFDASMQAWLNWEALRSTQDPAFLAWIESSAFSIASDTANAESSKISALTSASAALNSANNAALSIGAGLWVSGTNYAVGAVTWSPITRRTYRRVIAGSGVTDPSIDLTNWKSITLEIDAGYPAIRPSLDLDFANSQTVDPRITFTRASTATRTNNKGLIELVPSGVPRIDFDPVTGVCKGLLVEEQRTNLLTYSEMFDNAAWTKVIYTVTPNSTTAPDGTTTADFLDEATTANTDRHAVQSQTITASATYTQSIYLKQGPGRTTAQVRISSNNGTFSAFFANINLATGVITNSGLLGGMVSGSAFISSASNGFYRVSLTGVLSSDVTQIAMVVYAHNGTSSAYVGASGVGIYIWGAQLEVGAFPTSYIPTVASQVTRAADVASMTGVNFSSWWNSAAGTLVTTSNVRSGSNVVTAGTAAVTSTASASTKYALAYSSSNPASTLVIGTGLHEQIVYYPKSLTTAEQTALKA